jgi:hypothetical protein
MGRAVGAFEQRQEQAKARVRGRKVQAAVVGVSSSGFFALERRAQNDKQEQTKENTGVLRLRLAQVRQTPLRMTASVGLQSE